MYLPPQMEGRSRERGQERSREVKRGQERSREVKRGQETPIPPSPLPLSLFPSPSLSLFPSPSHSIPFSFTAPTPSKYKDVWFEKEYVGKGKVAGTVTRMIVNGHPRRNEDVFRVEYGACARVCVASGREGVRLALLTHFCCSLCRHVSASFHKIQNKPDCLPLLLGSPLLSSFSPLLQWMVMKRF